MESPLDILSRAAGMVSRNSESGSGTVAVSTNSESGSGTVAVSRNSESGSGTVAVSTNSESGIGTVAVSTNSEPGSASNSSSSGSSNEQINGNARVDNQTQCRILKLALVSSNSSNSLPNNSTSQIQNGTTSKGPTGLGRRGRLQDYTKSEGCSPPPVGLRIVVGDRVEKRIARQREQHDVLSSSDSDTPIDMSMKKVKRKLISSDSNDEASSDEKERDEKIKRKRPSVISFASHHRMMSNVTGFDVDDHFKKSLGLEFYNSVFSGDKKKSATTPPSRSPVPTATTPDEVHLEHKKKIFKPKIMASHAKVIKSVNHAPDLDNSVDDHFAKALGKSTWMRLQQGL